MTGLVVNLGSRDCPRVFRPSPDIDKVAFGWAGGILPRGQRLSSRATARMEFGELTRAREVSARVCAALAVETGDATAACYPVPSPPGDMTNGPVSRVLPRDPAA